MVRNSSPCSHTLPTTSPTDRLIRAQPHPLHSCWRCSWLSLLFLVTLSPLALTRGATHTATHEATHIRRARSSKARMMQKRGDADAQRRRSDRDMDALAAGLRCNVCLSVKTSQRKEQKRTEQKRTEQKGFCKGFWFKAGGRRRQCLCEQRLPHPPTYITSMQLQALYHTPS